jgi:4-amino-4-deoxy-L-arabinose transferase-like glycosyltransferase
MRACTIAAALAALLLALTATTTLWDRDEARFGQAAVEMLSSGDYLLPTFNGELRPQKPPLVYWLMTISLRVLGQTEMAVRLWSSIAMAVAALATFALGRRLWSPNVGLGAMAILGLTPLTMLEGVAATADAVLLAAITVSIAIASRAIEEVPTWRATAGLGLALGVGALAKGPVAIGLPVGIMVVTHFAAFRSRAWSHRRAAVTLGAAAAVGLSLFSLWLVPAAIASSGGIATRGLVRENLVRLLQPMEGHGTSLALAPFYYPAVITVGFAPWVVYLPRALRRMMLVGVRTSPRNALLAAWIGVPLVLFTVSATKLPHYILPAFPALALSVAAVIAAGTHPSRPFETRTKRLIGVSVVTVLGLGAVAGPIIERYKPVPHVMKHVRDSNVSGPLYAFGFEEPSLAFYGRRRLVGIQGNAALEQWARAPGEALLVAPRRALDVAERTHGPFGLRELGRHSGWNYVKGDWVELVAFVRPGDR